MHMSNDAKIMAGRTILRSSEVHTCKKKSSPTCPVSLRLSTHALRPYLPRAATEFKGTPILSWMCVVFQFS